MSAATKPADCEPKSVQVECATVKTIDVDCAAKLPPAAGCAEHEEPPAPLIVKWIVNNSCAMFGVMSTFMLIMMIACLTTINNQTEPFPTTGSSGFQDRLDINSLSTDAWTVAMQQKKIYDNGGVEVEEEDCGWGGCQEEDDSIVTPQTKPNQRWNNLLIFATKTGEGFEVDETGNLLTASNLARAKASLDRMMAQPGFEFFCQKAVAGGMWATIARGMSGATDDAVMECATPLSPLTWMFPSTVESTYTFGAYDASKMSQAAPLFAQMGGGGSGGGGGGGGWGGRRLDEMTPNELLSMSDAEKLLRKFGEKLHAHRRELQAGGDDMMAGMVALFPAAGTEMFIEPHLADTPLFQIMRVLTNASVVAGKKTAVFDGQGTEAGGSCVVKHADFSEVQCDFAKMECTSCNSQWCECDTSVANGGSQQERIDSILTVVHTSGFANFMMGKQFTADNLKTPLMRFSLAYAGPLTADNPYLATKERERAVEAGGFRNPNDKEPCDDDGRGSKRDCQMEAFLRWAKEVKPLIDGDGDGCDESPLSWVDTQDGQTKHEYGERPASLNCDAETKAYGNMYDEKNLGVGMEVLYLWSAISFQEILNVLYHDGALAFFSIAFVVFYLRVHSGSWFLAALGMTHIVMSFPLAFMLYRYVFGITPFYILSFLSVYIILAIGADDIFVFMDAWRQSARVPSACVDLEVRMAWVWRRAAKAMLITSATTFGAFTATALSQLNDVSTFGLFTASLVAANYFFVITYFPCVVLIYHRYFESRKSKTCAGKFPVPCGCCPCFLSPRQWPQTPEKGAEVPAASVVAQPGSGAPTPAGANGAGAGKKRERRTMEVFFEDKLSDFVNKPAAHRSMVVGLFIFALVLIFGGAIHLGPTTKADQLLPSWHPFQRIITLFNEGFATGSDTPMKTNVMLWGFNDAKPIDKDGIGRYDPDLGTVQWDDEFDLTAPESQAYMLKVCEDLLTYKVTSGSSVGQKTAEGQKLDYPVRQGAGLGQREVMCPMVGLKEFRAANDQAFPVTPASEFIPAWKEFEAWRTNQTSREKDPRRWLPHEDYDDALWIDESVTPARVKMALIKYNTTLGLWDSVYNHLDAAYTTVLAWKKDIADNAPPKMGKVIISGESRAGQSSAWVFLNTQKMLVTGAIWGALSSAIFAFLVLCVSTGNPLISLFAITNILCIVGCILGFMNVLGWELGVIESVSCTILVGLSVDYVVHLANSYMESPRSSRADRVVDAFAEMGITVFGGAITSLGASGMLFACYFQTFFKFGGFMFMTISLSFIFANCYFMPLLAWFGPEGNFCSFGHAAASGAGSVIEPTDTRGRGRKVSPRPAGAGES